VGKRHRRTAFPALAPERAAPTEPRFRAGLIYDRSGGGAHKARRRPNKTAQ